MSASVVLQVCADTIVGNQMLRGVSGGQRKRVTTGEMMVGPAKTLFMVSLAVLVQNFMACISVVLCCISCFWQQSLDMAELHSADIGSDNAA